MPAWPWLAPLVLLGPALLPGRAIYFGTVSLQFHPWRVYAWEMLRAGELPLWNPLSGFGAPLLANYQSGLLYPPTWLLLLFGALGGETGMAYGQGWLVVLHLALAGWGMAQVVRALGLPAFSQVLSGLAFGCSGYLVARSHFLSINATAAWLPWVLLFAYRLAAAGEAVRLRSSIRLAVVLALLLLAGHAQTAWYTLVLAGVWYAFWVFRPRPAAHSQIDAKDASEPFAAAGTIGGRLRGRLAPFGYFMAAVGVAVLLAGAQLLPTAELLAQSQRAGGVEESFALTYSFWPWRLLGLVAPGLFGSPVTGDYWGYGNFWEDAVYIGFLPAVLAFRALWSHFRAGERRGLVRLLAGLTAVSFLLALGGNTPVFPFLYRNIPSFDLFQAPSRWTLWAVFSLSLLAGIGAADWVAAQSSYARQRAVRWSAAGFALVLSGIATLVFLPQITPSFGRAVLVAGVFAGLAALFGTVRTKSARWRSAVLAVLAADLVIAGWGLNPAAPLDLYAEEVPSLALEEGERFFLSADDIYSLTFFDFFRFDTFSSDLTRLREARLPNLNLLDRRASANQFDPLEIGRYTSWMEVLESARPELRDWMLAQSTVSLVGVRTAPGVVVFGSLQPAPRVEWYPCARPAANPEQAIQFVLGPDPEFERFITLERFDTLADWVCGGGDGPSARGTAAITAESPNRIRIETGAGSPGWLLLRDTYYPGWRAIVDGEPVEIFPANALFRAVPVPEGAHVVELRYRPASFYYGLLLSLSGLGLLIYAGRRAARTGA